MRSRRILGAALALSISGVAVLGVGQAFAASGPKGKTACSTVTGTASGTVSISGCIDAKGANTGGGSHPLPTAALALGGTVTWNSGKTSTFGAAGLVSTSAKKCPGYVKPAKGQPASPTNPTADKFFGSVTADTSGMKVPGKFKGAVCISSTGNITALKALKVN